MKKVFSVILKIIISLLGLIVVATILLALFFPAEKVRKIAEEQMQKRLHRQVTIEKVGVNIFRGLIIKNVVIKDRGRFAADDFVSCKAFVLKYDLLQLLHKRFVLEALILDSPSISVKRYKDEDKKTVFNFSDLMPQKPAVEKGKTAEPVVESKKPEKKAEKSTSPAPGTKTGGVLPKVSSSQIPINIEINELGLKNARVELIDTATDKFKENYSLHNVHFLLQNIDLKKNTSMKISTGFGMSVTEIKEGFKTDKDINLDAEITGSFKLFDQKDMLNPDGILKLHLSNGKLKGLQFYKELVSQGKNLTEEAKKYQTEIIGKYQQVKKGLDEAKKNKDAVKALGNTGAAIDKVNDAAAKLDKVDLGFISKAMDIGFLKDKLEFDSLWTELRIKDQKVISSNIEMKGQEVGGSGNGYTGFDQSLAYDAKLIGNKKYNDNFLTKALANDKGEVVLPFRITGTLGKPAVSFAGVDIKSILYKEMAGQLGGDAGLLSGGLSGLQDAAKQKLNAEADRLKNEAKARADAELKSKEDALKKQAEEEKKQQEQRAKDEAKKKLDQSGIKVPKF
jgi:hypothetical protein